MRMVLAIAVALAAPAAAQEGDAAAGRELAAEFCADCHDVGPGGAFKQYPPSFASIAVFRDDGQIWARIQFPPVHVSMPQMGTMLLHPDDVTDLVAYIRSLE